TSISTSSSCPTTALCISPVMRSASCCAVCGNPASAPASGAIPNAEVSAPALSVTPRSASGSPLIPSVKMETPSLLFNFLRQTQHFRVANAPAGHDLLAPSHGLLQRVAVRLELLLGEFTELRQRRVGRCVQLAGQIAEETLIERLERDVRRACATIE